MHTPWIQVHLEKVPIAPISQPTEGHGWIYRNVLPISPPCSLETPVNTIFPCRLYIYSYIYIYTHPYSVDCIMEIGVHLHSTRDGYNGIYPNWECMPFSSQINQFIN